MRTVLDNDMPLIEHIRKHYYLRARFHMQCRMVCNCEEMNLSGQIPGSLIESSRNR